MNKNKTKTYVPAINFKYTRKHSGYSFCKTLKKHYDVTILIIKWIINVKATIALQFGRFKI